MFIGCSGEFAKVLTSCQTTLLWFTNKISPWYSTPPSDWTSSKLRESIYRVTFGREWRVERLGWRESRPESDFENRNSYRPVHKARLLKFKQIRLSRFMKSRPERCASTSSGMNSARSRDSRLSYGDVEESRDQNLGKLAPLWGILHRFSASLKRDGLIRYDRRKTRFHNRRQRERDLRKWGRENFGGDEFENERFIQLMNKIFAHHFRVCQTSCRVSTASKVRFQMFDLLVWSN